MKGNSLALMLAGVLCAGALVTFGLAVDYELNIRQLKKLQVEAVAIQNTGVVIKSLTDEALEYSKRNPAITPILQKADALFGKPPPQPPAKPPTK
jgi:hypothetical protein